MGALRGTQSQRREHEHVSAYFAGSARAHRPTLQLCRSVPPRRDEYLRRPNEGRMQIALRGGGWQKSRATSSYHNLSSAGCHPASGRVPAGVYRGQDLLRRDGGLNRLEPNSAAVLITLLFLMPL